MNSIASRNVWKLLNLSYGQKVAKTFFKNLISGWLLTWTGPDFSGPAWRPGPFFYCGPDWPGQFGSEYYLAWTGPARFFFMARPGVEKRAARENMARPGPDLSHGKFLFEGPAWTGPV